MPVSDRLCSVTVRWYRSRPLPSIRPIEQSAPRAHALVPLLQLLNRLLRLLNNLRRGAHQLNHQLKAARWLSKASGLPNRPESLARFLQLPRHHLRVHFLRRPPVKLQRSAQRQLLGQIDRRLVPVEKRQVTVSSHGVVPGLVEPDHASRMPDIGLVVLLDGHEGGFRSRCCLAELQDFATERPRDFDLLCPVVTGFFRARLAPTTIRLASVVCIRGLTRANLPPWTWTFLFIGSVISVVTGLDTTNLFDTFSVTSLKHTRRCRRELTKQKWVRFRNRS
jgi:hypothetical protein